MLRQLGEVGIDVLGVRALVRLAHEQVQLASERWDEAPVQGLPHQVMDELPVAAHCRMDDASKGRLVEVARAVPWETGQLGGELAVERLA